MDVPAVMSIAADDSSGWGVALVGLLSGAVGVVGAGWFASSREARARRSFSQAAALRDLLLALAAYESSVREYFASDFPQFGLPTTTLDEATGRLEIASDLVADRSIRQQVDIFMREVDNLYSQSDEGSLTRRDTAWSLVRRLIRAELRRRDA